MREGGGGGVKVARVSRSRQRGEEVMVSKCTFLRSFCFNFDVHCTFLRSFLIVFLAISNHFGKQCSRSIHFGHVLNNYSQCYEGTRKILLSRLFSSF